MPVQYTSIVEEHQAVRNNVGIFDISHMGQLIVDGAGACEWLDTMLTNNVAKLDVGTGQYTFLLNDRGGIIDDLIVYRSWPAEISARSKRRSSGRGFRVAAKASQGGTISLGSPGGDRPGGGQETAAPCSLPIAARILAELQFKARGLLSYFARCLARMPVFPREIRLPIFRSMGGLSPSRAPVTRVRTALKFSFAHRMR